jgi:uncharacterized protein (TIGR03067 family)
VRPRTTLLLAACLLIAAAPDDAARKDLERMQGDWQCTGLTVDGFRVPDDDAQAYFRTNRGDRYAVTRYEKPAGKGTIRLDATKSPRQIDATPDGPAAKKGPLMGIYEIDGDTMRICVATAGKERPREFASRQGSGHYLWVWTREKR